MRRAERLSAILERVSETGSVDVLALSDDLGVSGATIRRDLQVLSSRRLLVRTHGGALSNDVGEELPVRVKAARKQPEKRRIGQAAAALVEDGAVIGMTGGTTTTELARALADRRGITLVTNAINIAAELAGRPGLRLVLIGGVVRPSYELVGPAAEAMLSNYHLDIAFIGVDGLTPEEGCTTHDEMEAQTDRCFLRRAHRTVVVADSSKIGKVTFARISPLSGVQDVVTDRGADADALRRLKEAGVQVVTV
ncbi:DeoR family transcriptional regulator of aga operon [Motilibacter peucedani]|uniref:DeoR family transcriptional regulator of aga operon n=1 Tax=Motilibacter peucedani TaxID=598650 RepID=A0A420XQC5_9ACTN|nr:DeoR/GlpR family DNA-binding transcription regulator [Motilibacter peucedani]RKS75483.1 DeoR family transcriptional regulator of aga operon [Motilibacter peucedani]